MYYHFLLYFCIIKKYTLNHPCVHFLVTLFCLGLKPPNFNRFDSIQTVKIFPRLTIDFRVFFNLPTKRCRCIKKEIIKDYSLLLLQNGGKCVVKKAERDPGNDFYCDCPEGFNGLRCENNVNDCEGVVCTDNKICVDLVRRDLFSFWLKMN